MAMADAIGRPHATWDVVADVRELLHFQFMQNAFVAGTIVAITAGLVGYFMVLRGQTFAGHTLSQVGFPGAAGAALVGVTPMFGVLAFCVAAAVAIALIPGRRSTSASFESAAIGSILAFALALGFLFTTLYSGFVTGAYSFLFGTFLGISNEQVLTVLITGVLVVATLLVIGRQLFFASIDADVAAARGVPVRALAAVFLVVLGLAVAAATQITGTLLVFALLVAPAAAAHELSNRPGRALALSVVIAVLVTWIGLAIAYFSEYPIGFYVTTVAFAAYLLARAGRVLFR
jgi:zinc/manganese transport system permease protein